MNKAKRKLVLEFLEQFRLLERHATDEAGWIALKLSCDRKEAEKMVRQVGETADNAKGN